MNYLPQGEFAPYGYGSMEEPGKDPWKYLNMPEPKTESERDWVRALDNVPMCKDCRSWPPNLTEDHQSGDLICTECGLVLQHHCVDFSSEWRNFSGDQEAGRADPARVGEADSCFEGSQLFTSIGGDLGEHKALRRAERQAKNFSEEDKLNSRLKDWYAQLAAWCAHGDLNSRVLEKAKEAVCHAMKLKAIGKTPSKIGLAVFLYYGCTKAKFPRSMEEIGVLLDLPRENMRSGWGKEAQKIRRLIFKKHVEAKSAEVGNSTRALSKTDTNSISPSPESSPSSTPGSSAPENAVNLPPLPLSNASPIKQPAPETGCGGVPLYTDIDDQACVRIAAEQTIGVGTRLCNRLELPYSGVAIFQRMALAAHDIQALCSSAPLAYASALIVILGALTGRLLTTDQVVESEQLGVSTVNKHVKTLISKKNELMASKFWPSDEEFRSKKDSRWPTYVLTRAEMKKGMRHMSKVLPQ